MPWFKVDDGWWSHPKTLQLSDAAQALWVRAGSWSMKHLTDGAIPGYALSVLRAKPAAVRELVAVGLWLPEGDGYAFHDWGSYQPTREQVEGDRRAAAERQQRARDSRRESRRDGGRSNGERSPSPSHPIPSHPQTDHGDTPSHVLESVARDLDDELIGEFSALRITSPTARGRVLTAVRGALPFGVVSDAEVVDVVREILTLATDHVRFPVAYIEVACREKPETVQGIWERSPKPPGQVAA